MSLEREIRKIMAKSVFENFVNNPDCDICGDGSPCTCGESQEIDEKFSITLPPVRGGKKLLNIEMGRAIRMLKDFGATKSDIRHVLSGKGGRFQNANGEMFLVQKESVEVEEATLNEMDPAKHVQKNDETGMFCVYNKDGEKVKEFKDKEDAVKYATDNHDKLMEKLDADDTPQIKKIVKKLKGASKAHADQAKSLEKELSDDIRNLPKDKQRALQHADKTAKPKSKVSLAPTPGIKTEESNLDEAFEEFFAEGMKVFFVSGSNAEGNVHAKNEKEALEKAKKKGIKGKITIRDKGKAVQPKFVESVNEGYEGEVKKVLDKKGIDAYFKNGKLMVSKRDKAMVIQILKRQDFDMPNIQVEEIQMESNRFGLSVSLVDAVADVLAGKRPVEEKKKMDPVGQEDGDIDNDGDKDSSDEYLMKKRKAIGKAMKKDGGGKEPVDTKPKMDEAKLGELNKSTLQSYIAKKKADIKRKDANTATGRGEGGGKDRYDDSKVTGKDGPKAGRLDVDRTRDRSNLKLAKAKVAYKDANRDPTGPSSPDKKKVSMEDMTDAQMKRREEIVKELKKKSSEFEERYGDKADAVMYATATKMAMKGK